MERVVYVNDQFLPESEAVVSVFDRGFLFGDGVYEVSAVVEGRLLDGEGHMARLQNSVEALGLPLPCPLSEILKIQQEIIQRNQLQEGVIYLQVTRGTLGDREFLLNASARPTLVVFTQPKALLQPPHLDSGIAVITLPELRWKRRDIKSIALLPAIMAKQQAQAAEAHEAWWVEEGMVTEGSSSNAFIITADGTLVTRPLGQAILPGITRLAVVRAAAEIGLAVEERPFTVQEAYDATEAFITSTTIFLLPVVKIDGIPVADGAPGRWTQQLRSAYLKRVLSL